MMRKTPRQGACSKICARLAAVIGLLIWMSLSAVVIFLGAACNAELASSQAGG